MSFTFVAFAIQQVYYHRVYALLLKLKRCVRVCVCVWFGLRNKEVWTDWGKICCLSFYSMPLCVFCVCLCISSSSISISINNRYLWSRTCLRFYVCMLVETWILSFCVRVCVRDCMTVACWTFPFGSLCTRKIRFYCCWNYNCCCCCWQRQRWKSIHRFCSIVIVIVIAPAFSIHIC